MGEAIIKISNESSAFSLKIAKGANIDLGTCATRASGLTVGVVVPSIAVNVLYRESVGHGRWTSVAEAQTGGSFDFYDAEHGWRNAAARQQAFLRKEDAETRRISYLYDDGKSSRYGQFNHQVFIPTPRPSDLDSSSEDEDTDYDSAATSINSRSSSPESGGHDDMAFFRPRSRRNSELRHDRMREEVDSDGDESGSASTCSSKSYLDTQDPTDIPSKLADQLRQFRAVGQSMLDSVEFSEDGLRDDGKYLPPIGLRSGTVIKASLVPVVLALQPMALRAGASLHEGFINTVSLLYPQHGTDDSRVDRRSCSTS